MRYSNVTKCKIPNIKYFDGYYLCEKLWGCF